MKCNIVCYISISLLLGSVLISLLVPRLVLPQIPAEPLFLESLPEVAKWKLYLYNRSLEYGLSYREFRILRDIVQCESGWRQFNSEGTVLVGRDGLDWGLFQIRVAETDGTDVHLKTAEKLGLDLKDPYDNIDYALYLYEREGTVPWVCSGLI